MIEIINGCDKIIIMKNGLYQADCVAFMQNMDEGLVDLTVTSLPYDNLRDYHGYSFPFEQIAKQLYRVTKQVALSCGWWRQNQ